MSYRFGAVVLVPFPFTDQSTSKQRPAVVVSSAAYQQARSDLIIMAITSHDARRQRSRRRAGRLA
jgi:mRNA interferase MazF